MSKGKINRELHVQTKVNDGKWHRIQIKSEETKLRNRFKDTKWTLTVDQIASTPKKCPRKLKVANVIYIGAWPEYGNRLPTTLVSKKGYFFIGT